MSCFLIVFIWKVFQCSVQCFDAPEIDLGALKGQKKFLGALLPRHPSSYLGHYTGQDQLPNYFTVLALH